MERQNKLLLNMNQNCTPAEQAQGRANLGLADVAASGNYNDLTNRPTIPAAPVQSNWTEQDPTSLAFIQNKPVIPAAQVQSDWAQSDSGNVSFIRNKPDLSVYATQSDLASKQDVLTAGANIDITNNVISTEQVMVTAGTGVTVTQSYNPTSNVIEYEVSAAASAPEVFYAEYNVATVSDISAAKTAGKLVYTLIPGTYYPTVAYLRETTRNGAKANFASPVSDAGSVKVASVDSDGVWSSDTLNLATMGDISPHKVAFVDTGDSYQVVENYRSQGYEIILTVDSETVRQYFRLFYGILLPPSWFRIYQWLFIPLANQQRVDPYRHGCPQLYRGADRRNRKKPPSEPEQLRSDESAGWYLGCSDRTVEQLHGSIRS